MTPWRATLGAIPNGDGVRAHVWAPAAETVELLVAQRVGHRDVPGAAHELERADDGVFAGRVRGIGAGVRYWFRLNGNQTLPDPASRFQPGGVHGPSQVIDPFAFRWTDGDWQGPEKDRLAIYELHVGTFSPEGTFAGVQARLDYLASLGVSTLELMPVAEFPGRWNWGYDGVDLFAPSHRYGTPDEFRRLVDAAHAHGLSVILDVVYNHLGPDGAYLSAFSPYYFTDRHKSPWGDGVNLDGPGSDHVRAFFIENALHWIHEYHLDGLRLDATHALQDDGHRHFLAELSSRVREECPDRRVVLIAEDERNLDRLVRAQDRGGYGLDGVWSDDFHHEARRLLAGDAEGYFESFSGTTSDLATTIRRGWFFVGQHSAHTGERRGTDPSGIPLHRFVFCLQNHDQVGNRALGERLNHQVALAAYRAATALLLCAPETPLLFMGQEWAASSPFLYFTDHEKELGQKVTEGRRSEFSAFSAFADPATRDSIPDPQAESTFARSRLLWDEPETMPHRGVLRLYRALLRLRLTEPALAPPAGGASVTVAAPDSGTVLLRRTDGSGEQILVVARLAGAGRVELPAQAETDGRWTTILTTEDAAFAEDGSAPRIDDPAGRPAIVFGGPAAIVLKPRRVS